MQNWKIAREDRVCVTKIDRRVYAFAVIESGQILPGRMPSIDAARKTWHEFKKQFPAASEIAAEYDSSSIDDRNVAFSEKLTEIVASRIWEREFNLFEGF